MTEYLEIPWFLRQNPEEAKKEMAENKTIDMFKLDERPHDATDCTFCKGVGEIGMPGAPCQWCNGKGWKDAPLTAEEDE